MNTFRLCANAVSFHNQSQSNHELTVGRNDNKKLMKHDSERKRDSRNDEEIIGVWQRLVHEISTKV